MTRTPIALSLNANTDNSLSRLSIIAASRLYLESLFDYSFLLRSSTLEIKLKTLIIILLLWLLCFNLSYIFKFLLVNYIALTFYKHFSTFARDYHILLVIFITTAIPTFYIMHLFIEFIITLDCYFRSWCGGVYIGSTQSYDPSLYPVYDTLEDYLQINVTAQSEETLEENPPAELIPQVSFSKMLEDIKSTCSNTGLSKYVNNYHIKWFEDLAMYLYSWTMIDSTHDFIYHSLVFIKARCGDSALIVSIYEKDVIKHLEGIFCDKGYSAQSSTSKFAPLRNVLTNFTLVKESELFKKCYKAYMFLLTNSMLSPLGIQLDPARYSALEIATIKRKFASGSLDFYTTMIDTAIFIGERIEAYTHGNNWMTMLNNPSSTDEWMYAITELKRKSKLLHNPQAHGFDLHTYHRDLQTCLATGRTIVQYAKASASPDFRIVAQLAVDVEILHDKFTISEFMSADRIPPMAIVYYGHSSLGKSTMATLTFKHMAKVLGKSADTQYRYHRETTQEFWPDFQPYKWCIQYDDVAYKHPNICPTGDLSLTEIIRVMNQVPFSTPQAVAEDKGKFPCLPSLVTLTTNVEDLHVSSYFSCPYATLRRLPYVVHLAPKAKYTDKGVLAVEEEILGYPDFWDIEVHKIDPPDISKKPEGLRAKYSLFKSYDNIYDYLDWLAETSLEHFAKEERVQNSIKAMEDVTICDTCKMLKCRCETLVVSGQSEELRDSSESSDSSDSDESRDSNVSSFSFGSWIMDQAGNLAIDDNFVADISTYDGDLTNIHDKEDEVRIANLVAQSLIEIRDGGVSYFTQTYYNIAFTRKLLGYYICLTIAFLFAYGIVAFRYHLLASIVLLIIFRRFYFEIFSLVLRFYISGISKSTTLRLMTSLLGVNNTIALLIIWQPNMDLKRQWLLSMKVRSHYFFTNHMSWKDSIYNMRTLLKVCAVATTAIFALRTLRSILLTKRYINSSTQSSVGTPPIKQEEEPPSNTWYTESPSLSRFDLARRSLSYKSMPQEQLIDILNRNSVLCKIRYDISPNVVTTNRAFCITGHLYVINNHAFKRLDSDISVEFYTQGSGINSSIKFKLTQAEIIRKADLDLAFFVCTHVPPKKDMRGMFVEKSLQIVNKAVLLTRSDTGDFVKREAYPIVRRPKITVNDASVNVCCTLDAWQYTVDVPTQNGDCGSILLGQTPLGPVLLGIHAFAAEQDNTALAVTITNDLISNIVSQISPLVVCCEAGEPYLTTGTTPDVTPLIDLHRKSTFRYIPKGNAYIYGSFGGFRLKPKSTVQPTIACRWLLSNPGPTPMKIKWGPPIMHGYEPWRKLALDFVDQPYINVDMTVMRRIRKSMSSVAIKQLNSMNPHWTLLLHKYDLTTAINGFPGVSYVDGINRQTSTGFPWRTSKRRFLIDLPADDTYQHPVEFTNEIKDRVEAIYESYDQRTRFHPVFTCSLKDQAISFEKIKACKTRGFMASPVDFSLVGRSLYLSFIRLVMNNKYVFEQAPGMAAQSRDWTELADFITSGSVVGYMAGDFANYDKTIVSALMMEAFEHILDFYEYAGASEEYLHELRCFAVDTVYTLIDFNGDLVQFFAGNPSGHVLTVVINGIINSMYHRYAYIAVTNKDPLLFKQDVNLMTYGDDSIVGSKVPEFNHFAMRDVLGQIGVKYTMAEKDREMIPFYAFNEISFLKRGFVFNADLKVYLAPLEIDSISKSLLINNVSKFAFPDEHMVDIIRSATLEYFFHGPHMYEQQVNYLTKMMIELDLIDTARRKGVYPFASWESLGSKLVLAKVKPNARSSLEAYSISIGPLVPGLMTVKGQASTVYCDFGNSDNASNQEWVLATSIPERSSKYVFTQGEGFTTKHITTCWQNESLPSKKIRLTQEYQENIDEIEQVDASLNNNTFKARPRILRKKSAEAAFIAKCRLNGSLNNASVKASKQRNKRVTIAAIAQSSEQVEQVEFVSANQDPDSGMSTIDTTITDMDQTPAHLANFMSRPVRIANIAWSSSDTQGKLLSTDFPMNEFLLSTPIASKLRNYGYIKADLVIEAIISASPFIYGSARATYIPNPNLSPCNIDNSFTSTSFLMPVSQRPGIWISPEDSSGGKLTIPFFYPYSYLNLLSTTDRISYGTLNTFVYVPLASANGVAAPTCSIEIFAHLENVQLVASTVAVTVQSKDEYDDAHGIISKPASTVARIAKSLTSVPMIGPFAKATQIGATAISKMATIFGYTNVPVLAATMPLRPLANPQLASTDLSYPVDKLTLDSKNELAINPASVGLPFSDELLIDHLKQKESYVFSFDWKTSDAVDSQLAIVNVTPRIYNWDINLTTAAVAVQMTPLAWLSQMFTWWRGDIIYTFKVVKSPYHRGRLRFVFDPTGNSLENIRDISDNFSTAQQVIMDLAKDSEVELTIPYASRRAFLECVGGSQNQEWDAGLVPFKPGNASFYANNALQNGCFDVRVMNVLSAPVASSTVSIMMFVRGAPNLEFAGPADPFPYYRDNDICHSNFIAQSMEAPSGEGKCAITLGSSAPVSDALYEEYMGERVVSLRQMLHRYNLNWTYYFKSTDNAFNLVKIPFGRLPKYFGYDNSSPYTANSIVVTPAVPKPFSPVRDTLINWIVPCFGGCRGSVNWTVTSEAGAPLTVFSVERTPSDITNNFAPQLDVITDNSTANFFVNKLNQVNTGGAAGTTITQQRTQAGLNFQYPFMVNAKFTGTDPRRNWTQGNEVLESLNAVVVKMGYESADAVGNKALVAQFYCAAGPDFQVFWFINVPTLYLYSRYPQA